jgi:hypothetical protein
MFDNLQIGQKLRIESYEDCCEGYLQAIADKSLTINSG